MLMRSTKGILLACLFTLALLHVSPCARAEGESQTIRLPNNSSLTLLGWSYGKYHELVPGHESQHAAIPPPDQPDPAELASCETEEDALVFWIKRAGPGAQVDNVSIHMAWMRQQVRGADEIGHEITPIIAHWRMNRTTNPKALTDDPIALASFPRRGRTVILRVYSPDGSQVLGEFRIPNPVLNLPPPFVVRPFPVTATSGELAVTLAPVTKGNPMHFLQIGGQDQIYTELPQPPPGYRTAPQETGRIASRLLFTFHGMPSTRWLLTGMNAAMWDSSGNALETDLLAGGDERLSYVAPNTGEPFRLRIGAVQKADGMFLPDSVWSVPAVSIPAPGTVIPLENGAHIEDADVRLLGIAGAGVQRLGPAFLSPVPAGYVAVVLRLSYAGPAAQFLLRVSDTRGHPILPSDLSFPGAVPEGAAHRSPWFKPGGSTGPTYADDVYWVKVPQGGGKIDLVFALNRVHFFEFVLPDSVP